MQKLGFVLIFCILFTSISFAQSTTAPTKDDTAGVSQVLSPQEAQQMRDAVKALGNLFGTSPQQNVQGQNQQGQQNQQNSQNQQSQQKTMAEVADKALDLTVKGVAYIAQNIEKAAPWVWRVMMRQQYANAISYVIVPWGFLVITLIYTFIVRRFWKFEDPENINWNNEGNCAKFAFRSIVPLSFGIIFSWWGLVRLSDSIQILINPEYYAIKNLLQIILNPSTL